MIFTAKNQSQSGASAASPRAFLARKLLRNVCSGVYGSFVHLCANIILWNFTTTDLYIPFTCTSLTSRSVIATRPSHHRDLGREPSRGPLKAYLLFFPNKLSYQHIADLLCIVTTLNLLYLAFPPMPIHTTIHNMATSPVKTSHRSLIDHRGRPFLTIGCTYHMVHLAENLHRHNLLK